MRTSWGKWDNFQVQHSSDGTEEGDLTLNLTKIKIVEHPAIVKQKQAIAIRGQDVVEFLVKCEVTY